MSRTVWTPPLLWRLSEMLENGATDERIGRALGVSAEAVNLARKRHGIRARSKHLLSCREVARRLGIGCAKTVTRWIERGYLRGRRGQVWGPHRQWYVRWGDLAAFIEDPDHWHRWQVERITDPQLRALAQRVRTDDRYLTVGEVAHRCCVTVTAVNTWIRRGILPAVRNGNWLVRETDIVGFIPPGQRSKAGMVRRKWSPEEDQIIREMRASGATWEAIATALDRSISAVANRGYRLMNRVAD